MEGKLFKIDPLIEALELAGLTVETTEPPDPAVSDVFRLEAYKEKDFIFSLELEFPDPEDPEEWERVGKECLVFVVPDSFTTESRDWLRFESARKFASSLGLTSFREWQSYCKSDDKIPDLPAHPEIVYRDQWKGWGDFLGTGNIATRNKEFRSFEEARVFVQLLKLASQQEWREHWKKNHKPVDIPFSPDRTYKNKGWLNWRNWLGLD